MVSDKLDKSDHIRINIYIYVACATGWSDSWSAYTKVMEGNKKEIRRS